MQAVILAAGEGRRVRPLTRTRPKAMIPVANRPIIDYPIEALLNCGIREIIAVVGYHKEQVIRYLNTLDVPVEVVVQQKQLGTANALKAASDLISDRFLVLPGDNYIDTPSLSRIAATSGAAILVKEHPHPSNFGVVITKGKMLSSIIEKPEHAPSFMVSTGIFLFDTDMLSSLDENDLTDTVNRLLGEGQKMKVIPAQDWQDAVYPWDLLSMNRKRMEEVVSRKGGTIEPFVHIKGPVVVGKESTIAAHCTIKGPVIIGESCQIGPSSYIGPYTSIGAETKVEPFCFIENSILLNDVVIGHSSRITESIIGEGARIGDHTTTKQASNLIEIEGLPIKARYGMIAGDGMKNGPFTCFEGAIVGNKVTIRGGRKITGTTAARDDLMVV
jgi:UDP-N-acetylglucosamine diphosphorylase/glucosamine-1-phosphate N-acetyltransferase